MAEIKFTNVEIHNKYAEASHWDQYANSIPAKGDFISFEVSLTNGEKTVLLKQGDGKTALKDLPIISGLSADVSDWAKETLPDAQLSLSSTNAVQNKVICQEFNDINDKFQSKIDSLNTLIDDLNSGVFSFEEVDDGLPPLTVYDIDDALSTTSVNAVQNKVITNSLNNKFDKSTADYTIAYNPDNEALQLTFDI